MANVNKQWKRFMAVGCNHGYWADPTALEAVLEFKQRWKPHMAIHLGDYVDTTSFRAGAKGTNDENTDLRLDMKMGVDFLTDYQPDILLNGNHDIRLWNAAGHHNAIIAECAQSLIDDIREAVPKKCLFVDTYNIETSFVQLGDTKFLHGFMYNENGVRDHAEQFGKCVIAHLHRVQSAPGRRSDKPTGYCVGFLGDVSKFKYASNRRGTSQWSQGFAWGEYSDNETIVRLEQRNKEGKWRLPL